MQAPASWRFILNHASFDGRGLRGIRVAGLDPDRLEDVRALLKRAREDSARALLTVDGEPQIAEARDSRDRAGAAIEGHLLPRLADLEAPAVVVVGGSTGAGKSTAINSIAGVEISAAGARRPTTTAPVLVCHPDDLDWFSAREFLGLAEEAGGTEVKITPSEQLPAGMALIDSPDIDSVAASNRLMADRLLAAADLWLWVTTPRRYGDKRPLDYLRRAGDTGRPIAVIINKLAAESRDEVIALATERLAEVGLKDATLFTADLGLTEDGELQARDIKPIRAWVTNLASPDVRREAIARGITAGLRATGRDLGVVVKGLNAERDMATRLISEAEQAYASATQSIEDALVDGSLLRGEVIRQMPEALGTGAVMRQIDRVASEVRRMATSALPDAARATALGALGSVREAVGSLFPGAAGDAIRGRTDEDEEISVGPGADGAKAGRRAASIGQAASQSLVGLINVQAQAAAGRAVAAWRADRVGADALGEEASDLSHAADDFSERAMAAIEGWRDDLVTLVKELGEPRLRNAKVLSIGINFLAGALMLVVFAGTGGALVGTEVVIAGGVAAAAHKLLIHVLGRETVAHLARRSRALLDEQIEALLEDEVERFRLRAESLVSDPDLAADLAPAVAELAGVSG